MKKTDEAIECGHCGEKNRMRVVGDVRETQLHDQDGMPPFEAGTLYEVAICPRCQKPMLLWGSWHDHMDDDEYPWRPEAWFPTHRARLASQLLERQEADLKFMRLAIEEARQSRTEPNKVNPLVGAVAARDGLLVKSAHRGQQVMGHHAEFRLLEYECKAEKLTGATVYTTLEPCTNRNHPKIPCAIHLIRRKVKRVVIGMLDPDERIRGKGVLALRKHNIQVDLFPPNLMAELEELNRAFINEKESSSTESVMGPGTGKSGQARGGKVSQVAPPALPIVAIDPMQRYSLPGTRKSP